MKSSDQLGGPIAYFALKHRIPAVVAVSGQDIRPDVFTVQLKVQRVRCTHSYFYNFCVNLLMWLPVDLCLLCNILLGFEMSDPCSREIFHKHPDDCCILAGTCRSKTRIN
jgi:hypothetical protein